MVVRHNGHTHDVYLGDDGTMDTVIEVDGVTLRYYEADRDVAGEVRVSWLRDRAREACAEGVLEEEARDE